MNKTRFYLLIMAIMALLPMSRGYVASANKAIEFATGIAPFEGRAKESDFYPYLSKENRTYASWLKDGHRYIKQKEFEQAIWAFRKAAHLRPASQEAHFMLAIAYEKRGLEGLPGDYTDWERLAEKEYELAIAIADHLPARFNLAMLQHKMGKFGISRRNLEHILLVGKASDALYKRADAVLGLYFEQNVKPDALTFISEDEVGTCLK